MKIQWFNRGRTLAPDDDFFLPELCEPEALLGLVLLAELLVLVLVLAGLWILFGPQAPGQAGAIPGELADKYVAPGFAQVERLGADLLRPLLKKLGIGIAPERVFTVLLVLAGALILRDFYHQMVNARRRKRQG